MRLTSWWLPFGALRKVLKEPLKEGKDLQVVQVFAVPKKISTTEKYRQSVLKELQVPIEKHHPLGRENINGDLSVNLYKNIAVWEQQS